MNDLTFTLIRLTIESLDRPSEWTIRMTGGQDAVTAYNLNTDILISYNAGTASLSSVNKRRSLLSLQVAECKFGKALTTLNLDQFRVLLLKMKNIVHISRPGLDTVDVKNYMATKYPGYYEKNTVTL